MVMVIGKAEQNGDSLRIIVNEVYPMEKVRDKFTKSIIISLKIGDVQENAIAELRKVAERHRGKCACYFRVVTPESEGAQRYHSTKFIVAPTDQFIEEVETILGPKTVRISA
jgi:DNA polymerase-3 subunit alpha